MSFPTRPGAPGILRIGLSTIALLAAVSLVSWLLGVDRLPEPADPTLGGDATASFGQIASGGVQDTARVVQLGRLGADLDESSGLAVSRFHDGVVWSHNDGDEGRLYAIRSDGTPVGSFEVEGVEVSDWEDMDLNRCPADIDVDGDCLFVADIGDNDARRDRVAIDVVAEPDPTGVGPVRALRRVWFRYPEGAVDAEALAVTDEGEAIVATKGDDGSSRLYRVGLVGDSVAPDGSVTRTATLVGSLPVVVDRDADRITGAALSPDGRTLAVRNHHAVYLFDAARLPGAPVLCEIGAWQPQGEGIDFIRPNMLILTSEQEEGRAPVIRLRCP